MKTIITFLISCFIITHIVFAQTPYDDFAPELKNKKMLELSNESYRIYNGNEDSQIAFIEYDEQNQQLLYFENDSTLFGSVSLSSTDYKWHSVDPMAEEYTSWSPYNYVFNNPIIWVDPDGACPTCDEMGTSSYYMVGATTTDNGVKYIMTGGGWEQYDMGFTGYVDGQLSWSKTNYWKDLPTDYNSLSGYNYTADDLRMRSIYMESRYFSGTIQSLEASGRAEPFGAEAWADFHGAEYYNMYRLAAGTTLAFQFVGAAAIPASTATPRSFNVTARGTGNWPPNEGFYGNYHMEQLQVGQQLSRYGDPRGYYLSPSETPFINRGLPSSYRSLPLNTYTVQKPFYIKSGTIAPAFNSWGGGIQYKTASPISRYINQGYLK